MGSAHKALAAFLLAVFTATASAQGGWPARPVRFIVPLPPGGNGIIGTEAPAKAAPDGYTIGNGSAMHLATEMLAQRAGLQMVHVPYKGMGGAMQDLMAGNVQFTIDISAMAHVKQGRLKALGVASSPRYSGSPELASFAEQGLADFELVTWLSLHAPAGLPAELQKRINAGVNGVLQMPQVREHINAMNLDVIGGTPAQLAAHLAAERRKFAAVITAAGIKAD